MKLTLTKELIDGMRRPLKAAMQEWLVSRDGLVIAEAKIDALCDLALVGLSVQPRPIPPPPKGE